MSILYIRLPSKVAADNTQHWIALPCPFALVSRGDAIEREGVVPLADLADMVGKAQRVVLLIAASDVTLLRLQVPPLSAARLRAALPHLVEDQLMSDPAECVIVAGPSFEGLRTVAVVNRAWLEILSKTMMTFGANNITGLPAQLCLPFQAGAVSAAVAGQGADLDLTLRLSEHEGIGLPIMPEQPEAAANEVIQTLCTLVPEKPVTLYVPQEDVPGYRETVDTLLALDQRVTVYADNWSRWITGANDVSLNLMGGTGADSGAKVDWRSWRWPLVLATIALLVNVVGLNIDWWRMKRESDALRTTMIQTYKTAYPKDTVILDPIAQMRKNIANAQHDAGQVAPDDFTALASNFGEAWEKVMPATGSPPVIPTVASIEYSNRSLSVRMKEGVKMPTEKMKTALAARNLSLKQSDGVWQIRSSSK